jgi:hypothetical protein
LRRAKVLRITIEEKNERAKFVKAKIPDNNNNNDQKL